MQAVDAGSLKTDDKALKLLLVQREVRGLNVQHAIAREAEHVLVLRIPRNAVGVGLLEQQLLRIKIPHQTCILIVNDCKLAAAGAEIEASHRCSLLYQVNREWVINEYFGVN